MKLVKEHLEEALGVGIGSGGMAAKGSGNALTPMSQRGAVKRQEIDDEEENLDLGDLSGEFFEEEEVNEFNRNKNPEKTLKLGNYKPIKIGQQIRIIKTLYWHKGKQMWLNYPWDAPSIDIGTDGYIRKNEYSEQLNFSSGNEDYIITYDWLEQYRDILFELI